MSIGLQLLVNGLVFGGLLGVVALGLALIFGVMRVVNFAHGEVVTLGAYVTWLLVTRWEVPPLLAVPVALLAGLAIGWALQRTVLSRLAGRPDHDSLMVTYGLSVAGVGLLTAVFSGDYRNYSAGPSGYVDVAGIVIGWRGLTVLVICVGLVSLTMAFIQRTRMGSGLRALAQHRDAAASCGVNVPLNEALAFALATALAAAAGSLISLTETITPSMGRFWLLDAFVVVVLGGLGSIPGALAAAAGIGIARAVIGYALDDTWARILTYLLLYVALLARPQGLFGRKEAA